MTQTYLRLNSGAGVISIAAEEAATLDASCLEELAVLDMLGAGMTDAAVHCHLSGSWILGHRQVSREWMDALIERVRTTYDLEDMTEADEATEDRDGEDEAESEDFEEVI